MHSNIHQRLFVLIIVLVIASLMSCQPDKQDPINALSGDKSYTQDYTKWSDYLGGPDRNHYTTLSQISPDNIAQLEITWTYEAPDSGQMQMNAIIVDSILYGISAGLKVFALHAATGKEIWSSGVSKKEWHSISRGLSYWTDGTQKRILYTAGSFLHAVDALTGQSITSFGKNGKVDLHTGLPDIAQEKFIISSTPGTIYKDLIIMPLRLSEGADAAPGDIRAFDVRTGALMWTFHTIPYPDEDGYKTWENKDAYKNIDIGAANNWAGMAVDIQKGILFVPTGSASPDFYGGNRKGSNLYSDCLLALNADTGEKLWHFQFTHHDIWDRDPPAPPNLIKVQRDGRSIEAVAQITKQGFVFVFDRLTGNPLFDIEERAVPTSRLEGEEAWPTQPAPTLPLPFARQSYELTADDISPYAPNKEELASILVAADKRWYAPPDTSPVFLLPGYDGGAEWGGAGADPDKGIIYINSNEMGWILQMEDQKNLQSMSPSKVLYMTYCASCHKEDMSGIPVSGFPSLQDIDQKLSKKAIFDIITHGKGMMTGHPYLTVDQRNLIVDFVTGEEKKEITDEGTASNILPYRHNGYKKFLDSNGLPGISPPWGTLNAIDLNTGQYLWKIPLGNTESLKNMTEEPTGTESYGGPIVTSNGLLIQAGTKDGYIRAFDRKNGKTLWEQKLPAASFATPSTYEVNGKQYIVVACGGEKLGTPKGNKIIAFSLPN